MSRSDGLPACSMLILDVDDSQSTGQSDTQGSVRALFLARRQYSSLDRCTPNCCQNVNLSSAFPSVPRIATSELEVEATVPRVIV